jgi:hypothetical protein
MSFFLHQEMYSSSEAYSTLKVRTATIWSCHGYCSVALLWSSWMREIGSTIKETNDAIIMVREKSF